MRSNESDARYERLLRVQEVMHVTGLPQSSLYAEIAAGRFPRPVKLTTRSVAWTQSAVQQWVDERLSANEDAT
jgi:prophage regulatory protein